MGLRILLLEVREKAAALTNHHQKSAAAVVILRVLLEVLGELVDLASENADLDRNRTGILIGRSVLFDDLLFKCQGKHTCSVICRVVCSVPSAACPPLVLFYNLQDDALLCRLE